MKTDLELKRKLVEDGEYCPLKFYSELSELEKLIKEAKEEIIESALKEFDRHGTTKVNLHGFEITLSKTGRYDYSQSSTWEQKNNSLKELEKKMQFAFKAGGTVVDENTGEVIDPAIYLPNRETLKFKKL